MLGILLIAPITYERRAEVKKLVEAGRAGSEIGKTVGIFLTSVQNIKKALGLVKERRSNLVSYRPG